ncbi:MAG TPA: serine hydrolase [Propionicimonas sp.]|nr:serine hydrolase [Propionicimonas sp.]
MTVMGEQLEQAWNEQVSGIPGRFSLVLASPEGPLATRDADQTHYAASTIKLAALGALLHGLEVGDVRAGSAVAVRDRFPSAVGGRFRLRQTDDQDDESWQYLGSLADLMWLADRMITVSGNLAAGLVMDEIGLPAVRGFLDRAGLGGAIDVNRMIGDHVAEAADVTNTVTAGGLAALMAGITDGSLLGADATRTALDLLSRQTHRRMIPAGLPEGTWSASKGGWVPGVAHDVALVRPPVAPPYVLAICTTSALPDGEAEALVARLSAVTWEHWTRWHA